MSPFQGLMNKQNIYSRGNAPSYFIAPLQGYFK
jgi:hypothetical protein